MIWQTFGHEGVKKILGLQLSFGRFSHSILFVGSEALGKKMLALEMAGKILNTQQPLKHPDFMLLDPEGEIPIESVREFIGKLALKPFLGKYKVALINNAQNLNVQSQNALLKTLEEPPSKAVLFLVSSKPLLPTIISRSLVLHFNRLSQKQMEEFVVNKDLKLNETKLRQAFGLPGKAVRLSLEDQTDLSFWDGLKKAKRAERLAAIPEFAEKDSLELRGIFLQLAQEEILSLAKKPEDFVLVNRLLEAYENLGKNFNKKLVIQKLFLGI